MRSLDRDFDGSEATDVDLQEATAKARSGDAATQACELIRDAASETWTIAAGQVRTAWRGSRRPPDGGAARSQTGDPGDP